MPAEFGGFGAASVGAGYVTGCFEALAEEEPCSAIEGFAGDDAFEVGDGFIDGAALAKGLRPEQYDVGNACAAADEFIGGLEHLFMAAGGKEGVGAFIQQAEVVGKRIGKLNDLGDGFVVGSAAKKAGGPQQIEDRIFAEEGLGGLDF